MQLPIESSIERLKSTTTSNPKGEVSPFGMNPRAASATRALFMLFTYFYGHGLYLHPAFAGANVL